MSIVNPHDIFFKEVFSDRERIVDLINGIFPDKLKSNINLTTLDLDNTSYVDEKLKESFSDLVYNCQYKNKIKIKISLLFEHKSYVPAYPHLQLLKYMTGIWDIQIKQKEKITPVIPVILYHGDQEWKQNAFASYFTGIDDVLAPYIPDNDYILIDLSSYSDEELKSKIFTKVSVEIALLIMKNIFNEEKLRRHLMDFLALGRLYFEEEKGLRFLESVIRYIYHTTEIEPQKVVEIVRNISYKGGQLAMTTAMKLIEEGRKEGIEEGRKKGIEEGRKKELIKSVKDILEIKFGWDSMNIIEQLKQIKDIKELENIKEKIKQAVNIEEIKLEDNQL